MADNLLPELVFDILTRLHPHDVIRCTCVSKAWKASIRDPRFIKAHHQRSIKTNSCRTILLQALTSDMFDFVWLPLYENDTFGTAVAEIESSGGWSRGFDNLIIGCSNGLVCVGSYSGVFLGLWNPSIKRIKKIHSNDFERLWPSSSSRTMRRVVAHYGFGYDSTSDDYKVVETVEYRGSNKVVEICEVNIYSLISNSWKRIESTPCNGNGFHIDSEEAVSLNNSLSWRLSYPLEGDRRTILSLNLVSEKYKYYKVPIPIEYSNWTLRLLGDYLCICHYNHVVPECRYDIWIMKEFGVTNSWTLLFSVDESLGGIYVKPLMFSKSGEMVLLDMNYNLVWFHLEEKSVKVKPVEIGDMPDKCMSIFCEGLGSLRLLLDGDPLTAGIKANEKATEYYGVDDDDV